MRYTRHMTAWRKALHLCCGAALLLPLQACTTTPPLQTEEQPPLMAGEARFVPLSTTERRELQQALAPFLRAATVELWYSANKGKDTGTFAWCISPAESEAEWVCLGTMPRAELEKLADETTASDHGDTLDYWMRFELRSGDNRLSLSICPAEEFGVALGNCTASIRSRSFHKAVWTLLDKKFQVQKRFDKTVEE